MEAQIKPKFSKNPRISLEVPSVVLICFSGHPISSSLGPGLDPETGDGASEPGLGVGI